MNICVSPKKTVHHTKVGIKAWHICLITIILSCIQHQVKQFLQNITDVLFKELCISEFKLGGGP